MSEADLILLLNRWLVKSPAIYATVLEHLGSGVWWGLACFFAGYWFVGEKGAIPTREGATTRIESRRRVLLLIGAMGFGLLTSTLFQLTIDRMRPVAVLTLQSPIERNLWNSIIGGWPAASFPAQEMVLVGVITVGLFQIKRWLGIVGTIAAVVIAGWLAGVGYQWLTDSLAGFLIGSLWALLAFASRDTLRRILDNVVYPFEFVPGLLYPFAFAFLFDLSQQFLILRLIVEGISYVFIR